MPLLRAFLSNIGCWKLFCPDVPYITVHYFPDHSSIFPDDNLWFLLNYYMIN